VIAIGMEIRLLESQPVQTRVRLKHAPAQASARTGEDGSSGLQIAAEYRRHRHFMALILLTFHPGSRDRIPNAG
jgi:hypothetical protein